jgi:hypothetical protein
MSRKGGKPSFDAPLSIGWVTDEADLRRRAPCFCAPSGQPSVRRTVSAPSVVRRG